MGALPAFEEWKAPWEVDASGAEIPEDDQEIDKGRLKKLLYDLRSDKDQQATRITALTTERDALKNEVDSKKREGESEQDQLKRERDELQQKLADAQKTSSETMRLRAALKVGLPEEHIGRLQGETQEELEADAKLLMTSFGGTGKPDPEGETPRGRPRPTRNPVDRQPEGDDLSLDAQLAAVPRRLF